MPWYESIWVFITDHATVLSTVVTALCTVAIAKFTYRLVETTEAQGRLTERALVETRRAFVTSKGFFKWHEPDNATQTYSWRFQAIWENTGDTPTKDLRYGVHCEVRNSALPLKFDIIANTPQTGSGLLGAKVVNQGGISPPMGIMPAVTAADLLDAQQGKKFIYFFGWAKYFDVFDGTPERVTTFCFAVVPFGSPYLFDPLDPKHPLSFPDSQHSEGNTAT